MTMPEASRGKRQPLDAAALLASLTGLSPSAAAYRYAEAGIPVFPCVTGGKRPLTKRGFHEASAEPRQVARWWARWPRANIGMPTGQISGLEVVDVDVHGAIRGFAAFELARREGLTDRWAAFIRTPSGGVHAYYPADPELVQPSWQVARAGIDFRGSGGYVIVPPSIIAADAGPSAYALIGSGRGDAVPVDARALRQFLDPRPARPMPVIPVERTDGVDVERIARWVGMRGEGERNRGLFWASCRLIEAGIPPDRVRAALGPAAERAGLPAPEIETTIRSAHRVARGAPSAPTASSMPSHAAQPSSGQVLS
ncbi:MULTISPECIES: bifunctional DNA primase/polymerase [unclassified Microbacterium]|uniref:bifunctional DNA primase/polymerase n=1 Tax=unclassified Microbacterium TaxID=2609290 RepID=UPI001E5A8F69|nr:MULTISPECIES: bifunctional DNA primase/polymerase [unclassified Microbacterium]